MTVFGCGGNLSGGKTVTSVMFLKDAETKGKKIISNIKLYHTKYTLMSYDQFISILQKYRNDQDKLMEIFFNSVMLWDEARNLLSARKSTTNLNEMTTSFLMMAGKLDCDVIYTYQVLTSMIDLQLREITHFFLDCKRVDIRGKPIIGQKRILDEKILIEVRLCQLDKDDNLVWTGKKFVFDPAPFYKFYNTREIVLLDRERYLSR